MKAFLDQLVKINGVVYDFVWGKIGVILLLGAGIVLTFSTKFFQLTHIKHWFEKTIGSLFVEDKSKNESEDKKGTVSPFQALCTALGATIGTGNVAGVSAAIVLGGPGAVFWMWVSAFFGMITKFAEITLGLYFRRKNKDGEWSGGAMYYLEDGFGSYKGCKKIGKVLAVLFALFTAIAAFGIGNMGQINKITLNIENAFFKEVNFGTVLGIPTLYLIIGAVLTVLGGLIILGGMDRIVSFAEKVVPFMAIFYIIGSLVLFFINSSRAGDVFTSIFRFAFTNKALAGGAAGAVISKIITQGCKRGVFSNEAGLGSSVMVHASADTAEPVKQGMWGIFEVFVDTFVVCTMTAFVILSSGLIDLKRGVAIDGVKEATLVSQSFAQVFGVVGEIFVSVALLLFAFTTVISWSQYGAKAVEYLLGNRAVQVYKILFVISIIFGAIVSSTIAWDISDTFNGLMMIPNLIGVLSLLPLLIKLIKNYIDRNIKGKSIAPMLSYDKVLQAEMEEKLKNDLSLNTSNENKEK